MKNFIKDNKRIFRILFLGIIAQCLSVFAGAAPKQAKDMYTVKVTLRAVDITIEQVFEMIESKTEFVFAYKSRSLNLDTQRKWSLHYRNESVGKILDYLSAELGLHFRQDNYTISVLDRAQRPSGRQRNTLPDVRVGGTVKDGSTDEVLPGATISVKGTSTGTVTDSNGKYSISVPERSTLVFSFVGYKQKEVFIEEQTLVDVTLEADVATLQDVVVVGYGTQQRSDLTSAVVSLKQNDIRDQPVANFDQAMVGKLAGVQVLQTSGEPGRAATFRIRGLNSITAGNEPLFVIDGIPLDGASKSIDLLTINDIESIEVLKDASAAAIYGSRGSNGVVLITTNKGQAGKITVNYSASYGIQEVTRKIDLLGAYDYAALAKDAHNNAYLDVTPGGNVNDPDNIRPRGFMKTPPELYPYLEGTPGLTDTDWQDAIFQSSPISNHALSFSGGNENVKYFISGNYTDQQGIIVNSDYKRYTVRTNVDATMGRLRVGINLNPSFTNQKRIKAYGPHGDGGVVSSALTMSPTWPVYNDDGSYNFSGNGQWRIGTDYEHNEILNPVAVANLVDDDVVSSNLLGKVYAEYEPVEGLKYLVSVGGTITHTKNNYYRPSTLPNLGRTFLDSPSNPTARVQNEQTYNWVIDHTLTWQKELGLHHFTVLGGMSAQKNHRDFSATTATNFPNDLVRTLNAGEVVSATQTISEWSLLSYLARIQYDFNGKYLLTANFRADGSSRFGRNNQWGSFPSISAGWRISEEGFLNSVSWLSDLKVRASYGLTGNFQIGDYEHIPRLGQQHYILGSGQGTRVNGLARSSAGNPDLRWEKTAMFDIGLNASFFDDRLSVEIDHYNSYTSDLLLSLPIPTITGFGEGLQNIGEVNNKGWDVTLGTHTRLGPVSWQASINFSANRNTVKRLGPENTPIIKYPSGTAVPDHTTFITRVGDAIGSYYLLKQVGVYKDEEDLDNSIHFPTSRVGDFKFVDADGDGTMDVNLDRTIVGSYLPDYTFALSNNFEYKGIDLGLTLQSSQGFEILNLQRRYINSMEGNFNNMTDALDRWRSENEFGSGSVNRANRKATGNNGRISSWHIEDGSYVRLQNVTIGYALPKAITEKVRMARARIFFSAQNLVTWTNYSGFNPEVSLFDTSDALTPGVDYGSYPLARTYSAGINLTF